MTMRLVMPVDSSAVSVIDWPSTRSSKPIDAVDLADDRTRIGVPFRDTLAALDLVAVVDLEPRAVLDAVDGALDAVRPDDHDRDVARHDHQIAVGVARQMAVADLHRAVEIRLDEGLVGDAAPRRRCGRCAW